MGGKMKMMKVIRDETGAVINIGEWDYVYAESEPGKGIVATNPLPDGSTESEEEVVNGWDGGLYVKGDPRANVA